MREHPMFTERIPRHKENGTHYWNPQFVAFDGEGVTENEQHFYTLLACSNGSWIHSSSLSTIECLDFFLSNSVNDAVSVCYGASYDVNMVLKDISKDCLERLWKNGDTYWKGYGLHLIPRKSLSIRKGKSRCTLYDVFGFFQSSFVEAVEEWLGKDYPQLDVIRQQKKRRSQFSYDEFDSILSYCKLELDALVSLMCKLRDLLRETGIHIRQWHGAGAIAGTLLRNHNVKQNVSQTITRQPRFYEALRRAYAGGRIELVKYGFSGTPLYHYDLNSAYVGAIPKLCSMVGAKWECKKADRRTALSLRDNALYRCKWSFRISRDLPFLPFFYRNPNACIYFPHVGEGWYWGVEVRAAVKWFPDNIEIVEYWENANNIRPSFEWVDSLYQLRRGYKQVGNPAHKVLKLGLNSLYGKFIQHVGGREDTRTLPAFHQLEWASFITSSVRARLFDTAMQSPESIVSFQTDSLISTKPLDLPIGTDLFEWTEEPQCTAGLFIQSGVYFLWERQKDGSIRRRDFYRGFDKDTVTPNGVLQAYTDGRYRIEASSTRFITLGSALTSEERFRNWRQWRTVSRELNLTPDGTKRMDLETVGYTCYYEPENRLVPTLPRNNFLRGDGMSYPYHLPWEGWFDEEVIDGIDGGMYMKEFEDTNV